MKRFAVLYLLVCLVCVVSVTAQAEEYVSSVVVRQSGGEFQLDGPPVEALDKGERYNIKEAQARLLLGALGVDNAVTDVLVEKVKVAHAPASISVTRVLTPYEDSVRGVQEKVSVCLVWSVSSFRYCMPASSW